MNKQLATSDIQWIRRSLDGDPKLTYKMLAAMLSVSTTTIANIATGKTYQDVYPNICTVKRNRGYPKGKGNYKARKLCLIEEQELYVRLRTHSVTETAEHFEISRQTVYNYLNRNDLNRDEME